MKKLLIVSCARMRKGAQGLHYTIDYPERDAVNGRKDSIEKLTLFPR